MVVRSRKSQITAYMIIGILAVFLVAIAYLMMAPGGSSVGDEQRKMQIIMEERSIIESGVQSCLDRITKEGVDHISRQGGYYNTKEPYESLFQYQVPYYFFKEEFFAPSIKVVQEELCEYVKNNIDYCMNYYEDQKKKGITTGEGEKTCTALFSDEDASVELDNNVVLVKEDTSIKVQTVRAEVKTRLKKAHEIIRHNMMLDMTVKPGTFCFTCLGEKLAEEGFKMHMERRDKGLMVFTVIDYKMKDTEQELVYQFLINPEKV